jgi:glycerol-3-phosphate cytidylyltransferase
MNNKVGFTCSPFDLLHAGHIEMLRECKDHCDYLIVGLNINPCKRGKYPIQSVVERHIQLSGVKYVDEIIPYSSENELMELLLLKDPDIRFVGSDYKDEHFTGDHLAIKIFYNKRNHGFSSSELKDRVVDSKNTEILECIEVLNNETYTIRDNEILDKLTVSSTILAPGNETRGHTHDDIDEVAEALETPVS